ncbi:hypothetical protein BKD02_09615 [Brucella sp. 09RB8910]|nr:hypothetical protein BKD02_09615 [Brucella sp. 09RB8910]
MSPPRLAIIPILSRVQSPLSDARGALIVCFYAYFTPKPVPAPRKHALVLCMRIPAICRQHAVMADSFFSYRILSLMKRYPLTGVRE